MEAARAGVVSVIVSSDAAARGLDLPSLPAVIHYDVAQRAKAYVHRAGRAARAGCAGLAFSLVRPDQVRHFKQVLARTTGGGRLAKESLQPSVVRDYAPRMQAVLTRLQQLLEDERAGRVSESKPVPSI
jgi:superfamily II DNA/RNA helicase